MAPRALRFEEETLPSGARLILAPLPGRSSVSVSLLFGVGSRFETPRLAGISHFLEHIVFKGTERYRDSRAVSSAIEGLGGVMNASTEKEMTVFWARVAGRHLSTALDVLSELALAPRIDPAEVERERLVVFEELKMYLDQPADLVQMAFDEAIWEGHPLARDPAGDRRSLRRIAAPELGAYRAANYGPARLVVMIAGAFSPARARREVLRRLESRLPRPAQPAPDSEWGGGTPTPLASPFQARLISRHGEQVHLLLGTRCSPYAAPDRWALDLLNTLLGEGMSSRLFLELRENQGLAYDVHSFTARHRDSGAFAIYLATRPDQAATGARAAIAELRRLADRGLEPRELERAKAQMEGRLALQTESSGGLSEFLGHEALLTGGLLSPEEVVQRVRDVGEEEVVGMARELLPGRSSWRLAAVGPIRDREGLEAAVQE